MYKDKDKQNEASKERMRRYRYAHTTVPSETVTPDIETVTPKKDVTPCAVIPKNVTPLDPEVLEKINKYCDSRTAQGFQDDRTYRIEQATAYQEWRR